MYTNYFGHFLSHPVTEVLETRVHERVRCMVFGSRGGQVVRETQVVVFQQWLLLLYKMNIWIPVSISTTEC